MYKVLFISVLLLNPLFNHAIASSLPDIIKEQVNTAREEVKNDRSVRPAYARLMFRLLVNRPEKDEIAFKKELNLEASSELKRLETWTAESPDAEIDFIIGRFYDFGLGVEENKASSCHWMLKAAELGHAEAQNTVAYCYEKGRGFPVDMNNAVIWYEKAAAQNNVNGITNLGICYYEGKGVIKNDRKAYQLFLKASNMGGEWASIHLKKMRSNGLVFDTH
ncbi:hypothetical protein [Pectobacterium sp. B1J-3]|uniref:tetratricopeptide repeat protein n=1 Tax=Pectobacterium sp. B1J-3 TaxID=3385371 RepID=UPI0039067107